VELGFRPLPLEIFTWPDNHQEATEIPFSLQKTLVLVEIFQFGNQPVEVHGAVL
jgi:hypothetical protein